MVNGGLPAALNEQLFTDELIWHKYAMLQKALAACLRQLGRLHVQVFDIRAQGHILCSLAIL